MRKSLTIIILFILWLPLGAHNRALLVGIGDYDRAATGWSTIHGNNDVALLDGKLAAKGFTVSKLVNTQATKAKIIKALDDIVSVTGPGDMIYIHFSGHGQLIEDLNGDEPSRTDQSFVCYDACCSPSYLVGKRNYRGENHLVDDELFPILNRLKKKVGDKGRLIVVFDSCYSGAPTVARCLTTPILTRMSNGLMTHAALTKNIFSTMRHVNTWADSNVPATMATAATSR